MSDQGLAQQVGVFETQSATDVATTTYKDGASDSAVSAVASEVDHVASCGWPYASACPRCSPPLVFGERR
jgi:hypothetical protein